MAGTYNSFIVRIWTDDNGRMRGRIEHVTTRESLIFLDLDPMLGFISSRVIPAETAASCAAASAASGSPVTPPSENKLVLDIPGDHVEQQDHERPA